MTASQFRHLALGLPEVVESSHLAHPDFRVRNRIFATLGYPNQRWGMIKLNPEQQNELLCTGPEVFRPAAGAWGESGSTVVLLSAISATALRPILRRAWENVAANHPQRKMRRPRTFASQAQVVSLSPVGPGAGAARRQSRSR